MHMHIQHNCLLLFSCSARYSLIFYNLELITDINLLYLVDSEGRLKKLVMLRTGS